MKKTLCFLFASVVLLFTASTCDKDSFKYYRDSNGNSTLLLGDWGLVEVQYWTAGVVETKPVDPESLMEFRENGLGATMKIQPDGSRKEINTFHYEKYPGSVTIFTEDEYENNRSLGEDDPDYERGKTYYFKVIDDNTISSKENVSGGSWIVNVFSRF